MCLSVVGKKVLLVFALGMVEESQVDGPSR